MRDLQVVNGTRQIFKPRAGNYAIAIDRLTNNADWAELPPREAYQNYPDMYKKHLFLMVKTCGMLDVDKANVEEAFDLYSYIIQMFQYITPRDLIQMFPPEKKYDGHRYQEKDYFSTMKAIEKLEKDRPIGDEGTVLNLLFDYQNWDINFFMVNWMTSVSRVRQSRGGRDPLEEFFEKESLPVYTHHEDEGYLYNHMTGKTTKVEKPKPRIPKYLRLISS